MGPLAFAVTAESSSGSYESLPADKVLQLHGADDLFKTALWATFLHFKPDAFYLKPSVYVQKIQYTWLYFGLQQPWDAAAMPGAGSRNQGRINVKLQTVQEPFLFDALQHRIDFFLFLPDLLWFYVKGSENH